MTEARAPQAPLPARCPSCGTAVDAAARYCRSCGRATQYAPPDVDIAGWIKAGWNLFANNIGEAVAIPLIVIAPMIVFFVGGYIGFIILVALGSAHRGAAPLMAMVVFGGLTGLVALAFALVLPALWAGVLACFLDGIRTGKLTSVHLGVGFRHWWACTWVTWLLKLAGLMCLPLVLIVVGLPLLFLVSTVSWLALFRIVDRGCGGLEALDFAVAALRGHMWMVLLFTFIAWALGQAGLMGMYLGAVITAPIAIAALAAGYEALRGKTAPRGE
jgi:hypothetical protein